MKLRQLRAVVPGAIGMLLSMSAVAQGPIASDQPAFVTDPSMEPTMMWIVPYPDEMYTPLDCTRSSIRVVLPHRTLLRV